MASEDVGMKQAPKHAWRTRNDDEKALEIARTEKRYRCAQCGGDKLFDEPCEFCGPLPMKRVHFYGDDI